MTDDEIERAIKTALRRIAPESEPDALSATADIREELDLDSMDFLNFIIALHKDLAVDIPEVDYPALSSLARAVAYLRSRLSG